MTERDYRKELLLQKIESNRKLCRHELETLKSSYRPLTAIFSAGKALGRSLVSLGSLGRSAGLAGSNSKSTTSRLVSWLEVAVLLLKLWLGAGAKRPRSKSEDRPVERV